MPDVVLIIACIMSGALLCGSFLEYILNKDERYPQYDLMHPKRVLIMLAVFVPLVIWQWLAFKEEKQLRVYKDAEVINRKNDDGTTSQFLYCTESKSFIELSETKCKTVSYTVTGNKTVYGIKMCFYGILVEYPEVKCEDTK